jgi:hypothetical protein
MTNNTLKSSLSRKKITKMEKNLPFLLVLTGLPEEPLQRFQVHRRDAESAEKRLFCLSGDTDKQKPSAPSGQYHAQNGTRARQNATPIRRPRRELDLFNAGIPRH